MRGTFEEVRRPGAVALRVAATSLPELLALAGEGMFTVMYGPRRQRETAERRLRVKGRDAEELLDRWLSALLACRSVEDGAAYWSAELAMEGNTVEGLVRGQPLTSLGGEPRVPIRAVAAHDLSVAVHGVVWEAVVSFETQTGESEAPPSAPASSGNGM